MPSKKMQNNKKSKNGKVQLNYGPVQQVQQRATRVVLPWSWSASLGETAAGAGGSYTFAINNCFDPNFTGAGSQPLGFDQYAALYGRYRVLSVKFEIVAGNRTALPEQFGYFTSPQSTLSADPNAWSVQNKSARMTMLSPNTAGPAVAHFRGNADMAGLFGVTRAEFEIEHDFVAATGAGPTRAAYLHLFVRGVSGTIATYDYTIRLWMTTEFSNPVALSLS